MNPREHQDTISNPALSTNDNDSILWKIQNAFENCVVLKKSWVIRRRATSEFELCRCGSHIRLFHHRHSVLSCDVGSLGNTLDLSPCFLHLLWGFGWSLFISNSQQGKIAPLMYYLHSTRIHLPRCTQCRFALDEEEHINTRLMYMSISFNNIQWTTNFGQQKQAWIMRVECYFLDISLKLVWQFIGCKSFSTLNPHFPVSANITEHEQEYVIRKIFQARLRFLILTNHICCPLPKTALHAILDLSSEDWT